MSGPFDFLRDLLPGTPADLPASTGDLFAGSEPVAPTPEEASTDAQPPASPEAIAAILSTPHEAPTSAPVSTSGNGPDLTSAQIVQAFSALRELIAWQEERIASLEKLARQNGQLT